MSSAKWLGVSGCLLVLAAASCAPTLRELGDQPEAGAGPVAAPADQAEAGAGPTSSVLPMDASGQGGATHDDRSSDGGAAPDPSPSEGGASMDPGPSLGGAGSSDCFSPTQHVELAQAPGATGCPCGPEDEPECVGTRYLAPNLELSFECVDGAWAVVPDGACDGKAGCQTEDGIWASGAKRVPDPFSCNTCSCDDGKLNCTERDCPKACPDRSMPALGCLDCVDNDCHLAHYDCFTSIYVDCHDGGCFAQSACGDQLP
jgi:hypothetical protein